LTAEERRTTIPIAGRMLRGRAAGHPGSEDPRKVLLAYGMVRRMTKRIIAACLLLAGCRQGAERLPGLTLTTGADRPHCTNEALLIDAGGTVHVLDLDAFTNSARIKPGRVYRATGEGIVEQK
jgi:hypothetical protein